MAPAIVALSTVCRESNSNLMPIESGYNTPNAINKIIKNALTQVLMFVFVLNPTATCKYIVVYVCM